MTGSSQISAVLVAAVALTACEADQASLSPVAKRIAEGDVLGRVLPGMMMSEHIAKVCDGYTYINSLAVNDLYNAERVMLREAYSPAEIESGKREFTDLTAARLQKDIVAGKFDPARYCPTIESAEVQESLLGLRYLKKVR